MATPRAEDHPNWKQDRYTILSDAIVLSETMSWERFYHYLVAMSLLGIAWATAYTVKEGEYRQVVLACFGGIGVLLSLLWSGMGGRSRKYVDMWSNLAIRTELGDRNYATLWTQWIADKKSPLTKTSNKAIYEELGCGEGIFPFTDNLLRGKRLARGFVGRITSSTVLLRCVPLLFAALFWLLGSVPVLDSLQHTLQWRFILCILPPIVLVALAILIPVMQWFTRSPFVELEQPWCDYKGTKIQSNGGQG